MQPICILVFILSPLVPSKRFGRDPSFSLREKKKDFTFLGFASLLNLTRRYLGVVRKASKRLKRSIMCAKTCASTSTPHTYINTCVCILINLLVRKNLGKNYMTKKTLAAEKAKSRDWCSCT